MTQTAIARMRAKGAVLTSRFPIFGRWPGSAKSQLWVVVVFLVIAWIGFSLYTEIQEDAYITFRYASNLAQGNGFTFNPGERVLGTTTPLFTVLLATWGFLGGTGSIPLVAVILGVGAMAGSLVLLYQLLEKLGLEHAFRMASVILLGLHPDVLWTAAGGMETPLVLFAMTAAGHCFVARRPVLLACAAAALVLLRPDGAIWGAVLFFGLGVSRRWRELILSASVFGVLLLPWIVFSTIYFGNPLPHSIIAKKAIAFRAEVTSAWDHLVAYGAWFLNHLGFHEGPFYSRPFLILLTTLAVLGAVELHRKFGPRAAPFIAFPPCFIAAFTIGSAPTIFRWYILPLVWSLAVLSGFGFRSLIRAVRRAERSSVPAYLLLAILFVVAAGLAARWADLFISFHRHGEIQVLTRNVGLWLEQATPEAAVVATEPIGYIGYFSKRPILDLAGLISPPVVQLMRARRSNAGAFAGVVEQLVPDYVVLRSFEVDCNRHFYGGPLFETPAQQRSFESRYRELRRFSSPRLEGTRRHERHLTLYCRRGSPCNSVDRPAG